MDRSTAWRYLDAVGTSECTEIRNFHDLDWRVSERPAFQHPDRDALWAVERTLQSLEAFERDAAFDAILARPVHSLRSRLIEGVRFLQRLDHGIAWIGSIGVGKTTALAHATNLVIQDAAGQRQSVFPVGRGRTTVCEVQVKPAPAYGIVVEGLGNSEVRLLVDELVAGIAGEGGISAEHDRVLRNMADLRKRAVMEAGKRTFVDPIREMLAAGDTVEDVATRIMLRLNLPGRTQNQIILSDKKEKGLEWLAGNVERINFGQHPNFSVPSKVTVLLPSKLLRSSPYEISVADTKGIEGTTQRPDLQARTDDGRNLAVLCTRFEDAPGAVPLALLRAFKELGSDGLDKRRVCLLVLPRNDEAIGVRGDGDAASETREDGYFIRADQIRQALATHDIAEVPTFFYDAMRDDPRALWEDLSRQVGIIRSGYVARVGRLVAAATALIGNADAARSQEARVQVTATVDRLVSSYGTLPTASRASHQNLVEQVRDGHSSSIAASINRRGARDNFSVHHMLGIGVRADANARTADLIVRVDSRIADLMEQFEQLADIRQMLGALRDEINDRRQQFLSHAATIGSEAFKTYLDGADELWRECTARWGRGAGYRDDVAGLMGRWFEETVELQDARKSVDKGLQDAWRDVVLGPLVAASRVDLGDAAGLEAA